MVIRSCRSEPKSYRSGRQVHSPLGTSARVSHPQFAECAINPYGPSHWSPPSQLRLRLSRGRYNCNGAVFFRRKLRECCSPSCYRYGGTNVQPLCGRHARKNRVPGDAEPYTQVKSRQGSGQVGPVLTPNTDVPKCTRYAGPTAPPPIAPPAEMDRPSRAVGAQAVLPVQRVLVTVGTSLHAPNAAPVQGPNALQLPWRPIQGRHPVRAPPAKGRKGRR